MGGLRALRLAAAIVACLPGLACAPGGAPPPAVPAPILRADLASHWIDGGVRWPPDDGCAAPAVAETLSAGTLIDRFGPEAGTFFSPRGESYASRSMPWDCRRTDYRVYRVLTPIEVRTCRAAPWFGEPGGAITIKTAASAATLAARGALAVVSSSPVGTGGPQCDPGEP